MAKAMKEIGVIKRLSKMLPWNSLFIICKSFVRHHLEYRDILYDQPNNKCLCKKMRLFITMLVWPLKVPSKAHLKLNNELGLESLEFRWWFRKLCLFYKIKKTGLPEYLFNMIPKSNHQYNTRSTEDVATFYCRTDVFKYSYFPHTIFE